MTWVAVAMAGAAVIGGAASYAGSKKQADASKKGAATQLGMFNTLNAQQQPFIQSGYAATNKLNTLLGLGGGGSAPTAPPMGGGPSNHMYRPTPGGGVQQMAEASPENFGAPEGASNIPLKRILAMRAQNGDTEAARILGQV